MQRPKKSKRPRAVDSRVRRSTQKTSFSDDIKKTLTSFFIWFLVVINVILTASWVFRIVIKQDLPPAQKNVEERLVKVEVLNGCGVPGLAKEVADFLRTKGYDVIDITNAENYDFTRTIILDRTSEKAEHALNVASTLGLEEKDAFSELSSGRGLDVTVIIGKDFRRLALYK